MKNPYIAQKTEIMEVIVETSSDLDVRTYKLKLDEGQEMKFMPGQFVELSIPGIGEAPFGFSSSPLESSQIEVTIKKVGSVTEAIHNLKPKDNLWIRGPFGNTFPVKEMEGSDIFYIAGGLGLAPLRPLILYMLHDTNRAKYGQIQMLLAARSTGDFIFKREYDDWAKSPNTNLTLTIDRPEEGWQGQVGFPHMLLPEINFNYSNAYVVLCGPPIMIKAVASKLQEMGVPTEKIVTTLEMRMTCGVGKCGKCNIGHQYVCIDGPVFSMAQLAEMPDEY
ncbi:FAD/NAD(P)-binding protein [Bacillota bacterium LX-D]|nr:FAD/NAD(P)-binding protein [Bacillota bacterium LX-D]